MTLVVPAEGLSQSLTRRARNITWEASTNLQKIYDQLDEALHAQGLTWSDIESAVVSYVGRKTLLLNGRDFNGHPLLQRYCYLGGIDRGDDAFNAYTRDHVFSLGISYTSDESGNVVGRYCITSVPRNPTDKGTPRIIRTVG
ncbi:MAG: hypothetical protein HYW22_00900 [Candidatus Aenigmarchaeota archaeon]|nr:hypothetical protein [Candidatus Aenigmarchaeota archaeon]